MILLLDISLRAAAIAAIALALTSLLRRASAATRHSLIAAALLCSALLPVLATVTPEWTLQMPAGLLEVIPTVSRTDAPHAAVEILSVTTGEKWGLTPLTQRDANEAMESCCAARDGDRPNVLIHCSIRF
jgi:hypothetical protein